MNINVHIPHPNDLSLEFIYNTETNDFIVLAWRNDVFEPTLKWKIVRKTFNECLTELKNLSLIEKQEDDL